MCIKLIINIYPARFIVDVYNNGYNYYGFNYVFHDQLIFSGVQNPQCQWSHLIHSTS